VRRYMVNGDKGPPTLMYEGDAPNGGCIVVCTCQHEFNEKDLEECPKCKRDLVFPVAEW
jgi:hypothetical protein